MHSILDRINGRKVLVIGDVMLDRYWWGSVARISPEAPVPIVSMEKTSLTAGGAANVAANLAGIGAAPTLFGIRGNDSEGRALEELFATSDLGEHRLFSLENRRTSIKTRIVAHKQHVVRIDQETTTPISGSDEAVIWPELAEAIDSADAVILSDYAKGFLTRSLVGSVINRCNAGGKLVVVDPKGRDFSKYRGASVITPNRREAFEATSIDLHEPVEAAGTQLFDQLGLRALLVTEGEAGMTLFEGSGIRHFDSVARDVYDVTGAGDTVIAVFTAAAAAGANFAESAELANVAAGIVVGTVGTTRITGEELAEFISSPEYAREVAG